MKKSGRLVVFMVIGSGFGLILVGRLHQPLGIAFGLLIGLVIGKFTERHG